MPTAMLAGFGIKEVIPGLVCTTQKVYDDYISIRCMTRVRPGMVLYATNSIAVQILLNSLRKGIKDYGHACQFPY
jgi:hypothetical protein